MTPVTVRIALLHTNATIPTRATGGAAGFDLRAIENDIIAPGKTAMVKTGIALSIPRGFEGQVRSRSGRTLEGLVVANSPGTIDSDYRGEVILLMRNISATPWMVIAGERLAQLVIQQVPDVAFVEADVTVDTARGGGGFGSTGV